MDFRLTYDKLDKRVRRSSTENLDYVTYAKRRERFYVYLLIILVVADLVHFIIGRTIGNFVGFIVMMFIIFFGIYFLNSRIGGFGLSYRTVIYTRYSNLLFRELKVEEILIDNIRYLDVKERLFTTKVDMKYIDEFGKINEINFSIPKYIFDKDKNRYKNERKGIVEKLVSLQKVLDKGDF